ncbi:MAG: bacterial transcriptional activator domain-containing protein [Candidatus Promineifilaceae bacterium]
MISLQQALDSSAPSRLEQALPLYQGSLIESFYLPDAPYFLEWLIIARERLRCQVMDAFRLLCQTCEANEEWDKGIYLARHWAKLDQLDEEAHYWLIRLLAKNSQPKAALQQYDNFRHRLWAAIADTPFWSTQKLALEIAGNQDGQLAGCF